MKLTLSEIVADIPVDGGAIVVYTLFFLFVLGIVLGSRNKPAPETNAATGEKES